ncbi:MAG: 3-deoxy-7-phosphoheptulonate synthase [Spirochaetales bacterium]|uniref:3-deoxy-7-phosphoheptulonate synthase n=1 Tax=Bullifex sp. TaxID=2815808 RepID=UPI002A58D81C|nr:3-deoxy-7-phosphoheptulonate synthase [Bullifex sp.]MDD5973727.1 3-deoxy-7-phosphoheptulonate synthase [Spirochaetales bacterium]MDD7270765.1 3-deoxy-7-phosphoheptulonate synthase [Spirochaetales bacterium]MDY4068205.1 3-deoxy-7-phosphoheptulonate synthase [Bullifex sp.]
MIVILKQGINAQDKNKVKSFLSDRGFLVKEIKGEQDTVLGAVGMAHIDPREVELLSGVASVVPISKPYKLASRELKNEDTIVSVGNVKIGGNRVAIIAGPCACECRSQIMEIAALVREAGAVILRGGAFKPRTSPYSFQGLGEEGLKYLREAGDKYGMPVTTEVVSPRDVEMMKNYIDMFQIGARNMQNFELLKEVGKTGMPVLLKRGLCATIEEWLMAAEYLMANGTDQVVLCERGIRTFEKATRNTLDCSAIPVVQKLTHLPVIGDPSHATGIRDMVSPMALALVASGASGLMVEVHNHPEKALSDGPQSLYPSQFEKLVRDVQALCPVVGKSLETSPRIIPASITDESACETTVSENVIAFQGERGAFSELAIRRTFDEDVKVLPCKSFKETFDAVNTGKARYAVLPIENTLGGTILENIDLLGCYPSLTVVGEQQIRVIHNLIVNPGTKIEDIKKVLSHPQGLAQCQEFLSKELKNAEQVPFFDTAGSVSYIKQTGDKSLAAIAGAPAAAYNRMEILREGIETNPKNYTRFYILSREENSQEFKSRFTPNIASLLFNVSDESGALFKVLKILSDHGLNMKKLESRPIPGKPWEYSFFVEVEMKDNDEFNKTLTLLKEKTTSLRVLGTFRSAH